MTVAFRSTPGGLEAVVVGKWTPQDAEKFAESGIKNLVLNYAVGFQERSLSFIQDLQIEQLTLICSIPMSLDPIYSQSNQLTQLHLISDPKAQVALDRLPALRSLSASWSQVRNSIEASPGLNAVYLGSYDEPDLNPVAHLGSLSVLSMKDRPRIRSLDGLQSLSELSDLTIAGASRLEELRAIEQSSWPHLIAVNLDGCKGITSLDSFATLSSLISLACGDCGPIASLEPLIGLSSLKKLFLHESTDVLDGNLRVLVAMQSLEKLAMMNRKHYVPSVAIVKKALAERIP